MQSSIKAAQWLKVAEKQNFAEAQYVLGMLLAEGDESLSKNLNQGVSLLQKAAKQDHKLAIAYLEKLNLGQDFPVVIKRNNLPDGTSLMADKDILNEARKFYTGIGKTRDYERAYSMLLPLAKGGYPEAARLIGLMNLSGKGVKKNSSAAKQWLSVVHKKEIYQPSECSINTNPLLKRLSCVKLTHPVPGVIYMENLAHFNEH